METPLRRSAIVGVFLVLLLPLLVNSDPFPATYFPYVVGKALYGRVLIEIVVGLWLVLALSYPAYRPPRSWLVIVLLVYLGLALLAGVVGVSLQRSLWSTYERMQGVIDLAHWVAFVVAVASLFRTMRQWWTLLNFNLFVSLVMSLLGVAQHLDYDFLPILNASDRLTITLGNPTYVGAYMLVNVLIAVGMFASSFDRAESGRAGRSAPAVRGSRAARRRRRRRARSTTAGDPSIWLWRAFWMAVTALNLWMLVLSATRGALVGLMAGVLVFAVTYSIWGRRRMLRQASLAVMGVVLIPGVIFFFVRSTGPVQSLAESNLMVERLASIGLNDQSISSRLDALQASVKGFAARPILGWGPENYAVAYDQYVSAEAFSRTVESFDQAHNKLVEEMTTKGALGLVSYVALWAFVAWVIVRRIRDRDAPDQLLVISVGAALAGYFVQNLFLFDTPATVLQLMLLLSFAASLEFWYLRERSTVPEETADQPGAAGQRRWLPRWRLNAMPLRGAAAIVPRSIRSIATARMADVETRATYSFVMVIAIVLLLIFALNIRAYLASKEVINALDHQIPWEQRFAHFESTFDRFPPLANYPRLILLDLLTRNWSNLPEASRETALALVDEVVRDATDAEPRGWRHYIAVAELYHLAAGRYPELLPIAKGYVETAAELAPERVEVYRSRVRQEIVENDLEGARGVISEYRELNAQAALRLEDLENEVARIWSEQQTDETEE